MALEETFLSIKQESNRPTIDRPAQKLVELVEMFRKGGPARDYQWWGKETPRTVYTDYPIYQHGQKIFNEVVEGVLKLNPDMLSKLEVESRLTYEFLKQQTSFPDKLSGQELMNRAKAQINDLVEFEAWQDIDVPIMNLLLEGEPVKLGYVTFVATTREEIENWQEKDYAARLQGIAGINVLARVHAPGDLENAVSYTRAQINIALNVLRILCFPFYPYTDTCRIGVIGEIPFSGATPMIENRKQFVTTFTGTGFYGKPEVRKLMSKELEQSQWELVNKLILKTEDSRSGMENKLLDGIHWLGESTKPDTNRARFLKIGVALETLLGGEPQDEMLQVRGITAMLAERAAFIAGKDFKDRKYIDNDIREYYRKRSDIVHGREIDIKLTHIDGFGILVRRLALSLLEKLDKLGDKLSSVNELESWVRNQRYTLPGESRY
jgi:hypothetical protein